jgi:hypothetical protein
MSNPLSVAALATFPEGPAQGTDNLTALTNNKALGLGALGTAVTQYYDDNVAPIQIKTGASAVNGVVSLYLVCSEDGSIWTNGIDPNTTSDQSGKLGQLQPVVPPIAVAANATTYTFPEFSVYSVLGFMPSFWAVVVFNQSGQTLDSTAGNFYAKHSLVSYV